MEHEIDLYVTTTIQRITGLLDCNHKALQPGLVDVRHRRLLGAGNRLLPLRRIDPKLLHHPHLRRRDAPLPRRHLNNQTSEKHVSNLLHTAKKGHRSHSADILSRL